MLCARCCVQDAMCKMLCARCCAAQDAVQLKMLCTASSGMTSTHACATPTSVCALSAGGGGGGGGAAPPSTSPDVGGGGASVGSGGLTSYPDAEPGACCAYPCS
eukprot:17002-Chlamydomonas_euryale.AAC.7